MNIDKYLVKIPIILVGGPTAQQRDIQINPGATIGGSEKYIYYKNDPADIGWCISHSHVSWLVNWMEDKSIEFLPKPEQIEQMTRIITYTAKTPILVARIVGGQRQAVGIPEGGTIGFDGKRLYEVSPTGGWSYLVTEKSAMIEWLNKKHIEKNAPAKISNRIRSLILAAQEVKKEGSKTIKVVIPPQENILPATQANTVKVEERPIEV